MQRELVDKARSALLARRDELSALRDAQGEVEQELLEDKEPDYAEITADQLLAGRIEGLREQERTELRLIDEALIRIEAGTWGRCVACAQPIDSARIAATPWAPTCLTCAAAEARSREGRDLPLGAPQPRSRTNKSRRDARAQGPSEVEPARALEEPQIVEKRKKKALPSVEPTARPHPRVGRADAADESVEPERLARFVLEEATESKGSDFEPSPAVEEQLRHRPDELFPDRVGWPEDDLDEEEAALSPPPAASKNGHDAAKPRPKLGRVRRPRPGAR